MRRHNHLRLRAIDVLSLKATAVPTQQNCNFRPENGLIAGKMKSRRAKAAQPVFRVRRICAAQGSAAIPARSGKDTGERTWDYWKLFKKRSRPRSRMLLLSAGL